MPLALVLSCDSTTGPSGNAVATVEVTAQGSTTIPVGGTLQLEATPRNARSEPVTVEAVTWSSQDAEIAQVDEAGLVTGVGVGSAVITAMAGGKTGEITIQVVEPLVLENWYLRPGFVGAEYSNPILVSGGTGEYEFSITEGALPDGLSIDGDGVIRGVPTVPATYFFEVTVGSGGVTASQVYALSISNNPKSGFNIAVVNALGTMPAPATVTALGEAIAIWEHAIESNFGTFKFPPSPDGIALSGETCGITGSGVHLRTDEIVEDLTILFAPRFVDRPGGVVGVAGKCGYLDPNALGRFMTGTLTIDLHDLPALTLSPQGFRALIVHELAHVLGFDEYTWHIHGLVQGNGIEIDPNDPNVVTSYYPCGSDPRYVGENGVDAYRSLGGPEDYIAVDAEEVPGMCDQHWDESTFGDEIMTPIASPTGPWPLSIMTLRAMEDLWYTVDYSVAEPYVLPGTNAVGAARTPGEEPVFRLENDVWIGPAFLVKPDGTVVEIVPPR